MIVGKNWIVEAYATEGEFRHICITPRFDEDWSHKPIHHSRMESLEWAIFALVEKMLPNYDEGRMWLSKEQVKRAREQDAS